MIKRKANWKIKRIKKLASDVKALLSLDSCEPIIADGNLVFLRMRHGVDELDCPVGKRPLFDKSNDNTPAIKQAVVRLWIANLEKKQRELARGMGG